MVKRYNPARITFHSQITINTEGTESLIVLSSNIVAVHQNIRVAVSPANLQCGYRVKYNGQVHVYTLVDTKVFNLFST